MDTRITRRRFFGATAALALAASRGNKIGAISFLPATPVLWGDGKHDDTVALHAWGAGLPVVRPDGTPVGKVLQNMAFLMTASLCITRQDQGLAILNNHFRYVGPGDQRPMIWLVPQHRENFT